MLIFVWASWQISHWVASYWTLCGITGNWLILQSAHAVVNQIKYNLILWQVQKMWPCVFTELYTVCSSDRVAMHSPKNAVNVQYKAPVVTNHMFSSLISDHQNILILEALLQLTVLTWRHLVFMSVKMQEQAHTETQACKSSCVRQEVPVSICSSEEGQYLV